MNLPGPDGAMDGPAPVPPRKAFSPSMRVDALLSDWRSSLPPELSTAEKERKLYEQAWNAYLEGDYGFGLWCWHECDRLAIALPGGLRDATRLLGPGRYLGFSHRRALAEAVPIELVYRPRKGDMSTPRTEAIVLPHYQVLCVYAVRAEGGDRKAKAQLEIALGELEDRRRADPFLRHFETFRELINRGAGMSTVSAPPAVSSASTEPPVAATSAAAPRKTKKRVKAE